MKVYQRLAQAFIAEGCTATFGMMGDGNMYWLYRMHQVGIKVHECRHEGAALGMADGYARATRNPGVATCTHGPGVTQLATALVTASRARSPLVVFAGEQPTNDDDFEQSIDAGRFATACESGFVRMGSLDTVDDAVRKAFYLAKLESRPVLLSAPVNVQKKTFDGDEPYKPSSALFRSREAIAPNPDSRVTLARDTDPFGQRRAHLHWQLTRQDKHTMRVAAATFAATTSNPVTE